jgi:hypothetical protein
MSYEWKYIANLESKSKKIIDTIYCSHIELTIPIVYYWTVLLKNGNEYDLTDPKLKTLLKHPDDIYAFNKAKENYTLLN